MIQCLLQLLVAADCHDIVVNALLRCHIKQILCRTVDGKYDRLVCHDQTILHIFRDGKILLLIMAELLHLLLNLLLLLMNSSKQRTQFLIRFVVQRMIQINLIDRLYKRLCHMADHQQLHDKDCRNQYNHQPYIPQHHTEHTVCCQGNTDDFSIVQAQCRIICFAPQGLGITGNIAFPGLFRLNHLRPPGMVSHHVLILDRIKQNGSVRVNQGNPACRNLSGRFIQTVITHLVQKIPVILTFISHRNTKLLRRIVVHRPAHGEKSQDNRCDNQRSRMLKDFFTHLTFSASYPVSHAADRLDQLAAFSQLLAECTHMNVYRTGFSVKIIAPDMAEQTVSRKDNSSIFH